MRQKGSRTGQRKKVNYNAAATETSASQPHEGLRNWDGSSELRQTEARGSGLYIPMPTRHWMCAAPQEDRQNLGRGGSAQGQAEAGTWL